MRNSYAIRNNGSWTSAVPALPRDSGHRRQRHFHHPVLRMSPDSDRQWHGCWADRPLGALAPDTRQRKRCAHGAPHQAEPRPYRRHRRAGRGLNARETDPPLEPRHAARGAPRHRAPDFRAAPGPRQRTPAVLARELRSAPRAVRSRAHALQAAAREEILDCGDGIRLHGVYSPHPRAGRGLAILIHGWHGTADSAYLLSAGAHLFARGFSVFRLHLRDHGPSHHLNRELFNSARLPEVVAAVRRITGLHPHEHTFLGGFSLGGNFALRVALAAPAAGIALERVVAVCPVLDPARTMEALERSPVYHEYFRRKWRKAAAAEAAALSRPRLRRGAAPTALAGRHERVLRAALHRFRRYAELPRCLRDNRRAARRASRCRATSSPAATIR